MKAQFGRKLSQNNFDKPKNLVVIQSGLKENIVKKRSAEITLKN